MRFICHHSPTHTDPLNTCYWLALFFYHSTPTLSFTSTSVQSQSTNIFSCLFVSATQIGRELRRINAIKAAGPNGINSRFVRTCANQLCGVFVHIQNLSLKLGRVPQPWKALCVVPVPKTPQPKDLNNHRPVPLTSHLLILWSAWSLSSFATWSVQHWTHFSLRTSLHCNRKCRHASATRNGPGAILLHHLHTLDFLYNSTNCFL